MAIRLQLIVLIVMLPAIAPSCWAHQRLPRSSLLPQLIIVPGAAIGVSSSLEIAAHALPFMPQFSSEARSTAAAIVKNITDSVSPSSSLPLSMIFTGGYNIGVRYLLNGTVLIQPNNSFAAYALARSYASEAETMRNFVTTYLLNSDAASLIMVEEDSASTEENVQFSYVVHVRDEVHTHIA